MMLEYVKGNISDNCDNGNINAGQQLQSRIRVYKQRWISLGLFDICCISSLMQWIQYSIVANTIVDYYGVSYTAVDWSTTIYLLVYIPFIFPGSYILDTIGLRISVLLGIAGACVGAWIKVASVSPNRYWVVLLGQGIVGTFQIFLLGVPSKLAAVWFGPNEISTACSIGVFGAQLGIAFGFVLPPLVIENHTVEAIERGLYIMTITTAIIATLVLVIVFLFFKERPPSPPSIAQLHQMQLNPDKSINFWQSLKLLFTNQSYMLLVMSYGINVGIYYAISTLLNQLILKHYPDGSTDAGRIGLIITISGMIGSVVCGLILDKFKRFKETIIAVYILCLLSTIVFTFTLNISIVAVYLVSVLFGFFMTALLSIGYELGVELTYPIGEGTSGGMLTAAAQAFGIALTYLYSYLLTAIDDKVANLSMSGMLALGVAFLVFVRFDLRRQKVQDPKCVSDILSPMVVSKYEAKGTKCASRGEQSTCDLLD